MPVGSGPGPARERFLKPNTDLVVVFETHATSLDNEADLASGWFDVALSATGEAQARELGARRRDDDLAAVFCSDLTRSFATAEIAFGDRGVLILRDSRLRECDYGRLTRVARREIDERRSAHVSVPFPGGESYEQVVGRVSGWLQETARRFAGQTVLVIGHRATWYALEHLVRKVSLELAVSAPWTWQPGRAYRVVGDLRTPL